MSATALWRVLVVADIVLLAMLAVAWPYQSPGSAGRAISIISFVFIVVTLVGSFALLRLQWDPF